MTNEQIASLGPELAVYLDLFVDCFSRSEPRGHLANYVRGQLSDLPRKSVQPIADFTETPRRTLQEFLSWSEWDHGAVRDRVQQLVADAHAERDAIGIIDDSGHPKSGIKTACVQRQWCGNTGKIDNCVVSVHLSYASFDTQFRAMLDNDLFLPENGWDDAERRKAANIPDDVVYRPKYRIALAQVQRALANGIVFGWLTMDEWYAAVPEFLDGLEQLQQRYVAEIRCNFYGWLFDPRTNPRATHSPVENLCRFSRGMRDQSWQRFYVKDTNKGPVVWEVKWAPFWWQWDGQIRGPYWLIHARNPHDATEEKYFLSNARPGTPLEAILHVAFARWPIERCLEDEKDELGMSHFEVRKYDAILRHLAVTQVSHLFLGRQTQRLRGEKPGHHAVPSTHGRQCPDRRFTAGSVGSQPSHRTRLRKSNQDPGAKCPRPTFPHQKTERTAQPPRDRLGRPALLYTTLGGK